MLLLLAVMVGGALGASLRFLIGQGFALYLPTAFPLGTLVANGLGCFTMGIFFTLSQHFSGFNPHWRLLLMTGMMGALTTFSTYSMETVQLLRDQAWVLAASNMLLSNVLGLLVFAGGYWLSSRFF